MRFVGLVLLEIVAWVCTGCGPAEKTTQRQQLPKQAPEVFRVHFETTQGDFVIEVHRSWAPRGSQHFYDLVSMGFYDGVKFFRVVRNFVVQFGIHGDPKVQQLWGSMTIPDDPVREKNRRGYVSFAYSGPNTRTTQVFINLRDNPSLDQQGFAPFGRVIQGMDVVDRLWSGYGEMAPRGSGPDPERIQKEGNRYLEQEFPRLDSVIRARIELGAQEPGQNK